MEQGAIEGAEWTPWEPGRVLPSFSLSEVRYSRGFLRADFAEWFQSLRTHWLPLFSALDSSIEVTNVTPGTLFPEDLQRILSVEVDNEPAVLGVDSTSELALLNTIVPGAGVRASDVVLEYLVRRFLSSVSRVWTGDVPLNCSFMSAGSRGEVEVVGAIKIGLRIQNIDCDVWIGLGPSLVDRFDALARDHLVAGNGKEVDELQDARETLSVELAQLSVAAELLVDYLNPGTFIRLDLPLGTEVLVRRGRLPWAIGQLGQFNGRFVVKIDQLTTSERVSDTTRLHVEIAHAELDGRAVFEHQRSGAVLLTRSSIAPKARLIIGGEPVATATVGIIDGKLAVHVTERTQSGN